MTSWEKATHSHLHNDFLRHTLFAFTAPRQLCSENVRQKADILTDRFHRPFLQFRPCFDFQMRCDILLQPIRRHNCSAQFLVHFPPISSDRNRFWLLSIQSDDVLSARKTLLKRKQRETGKIMAIGQLWVLLPALNSLQGALYWLKLTEKVPESSCGWRSFTKEVTFPTKEVF